MRQPLRPLFSTTVEPSEYDIDADMERMVKLANKNKECYTPMDVGKTWGLYLAWKKLKERACAWSRDEDGNWETGCGNLFIILEGSPQDNEMKFCPYCGRVIC